MTRFAQHLAAASVAALVLTGGTAFAQQAAPPAAAAPAAPQPSASHLAAAMDVVVNSGMSSNFESVIEPMLEQLRQMKVARAEIRKDLQEVAELLKPEMELQKRRMLNTSARIYATLFTEAELKEIAAFFKSAVGKKYVDVQLRAADELLRETDKWGRELTEYVMIRAKAEMAKRGHPLQ